MPVTQTYSATLRTQKTVLEQFYRTYDFEKRLPHDPISFPRRYTNPEDIEVSGFIASCFAYGKIDLFTPVIETILKPGGRHPARFFRELSIKKDIKYLENVYYRFNRPNDVICLVYLLGTVLKQWGSLKNMFCKYYMRGHPDIKTALSFFTDSFLAIDTSPVYGKGIKPRGLLHFFPRPEGGSTCKRMNLFLRWMVRRRDIDTGIWKEIAPSKLIIPLDTHIARIARCLGLTKRATSDWKTAKEITNSLKRLDPLDPLKYDFALCHQGISGSCKGKEFFRICRNCSIFGF